MLLGTGPWGTYTALCLGESPPASPAALSLSALWFRLITNLICDLDHIVAAQLAGMMHSPGLAHISLRSFSPGFFLTIALAAAVPLLRPSSFGATGRPSLESEINNVR